MGVGVKVRSWKGGDGRVQGRKVCVWEVGEEGLVCGQ